MNQRTNGGDCVYKNSILKDIQNIQTIYITGHTNPDGDCIGSTFGFALAMADLGKTPVILLEDYDEKFNILEGREYVYHGNYDELMPDIMFSIDCSEINRLGDAAQVYGRAKYTYNIDHHISNTNFGDVNIVNGSASSACEVVYELINNMVTMNKNIATALYTGILTDTGGFKHKSTMERTHQIAGKLVSCGVDTPFIHTKIFMEHNMITAKLLGKAINNMSLEECISYTYITLEDLKECDATSKNTSGIVDYLINTEGAEVALFARQVDENTVKISLRSKELDVNEVAGLYGGGGHKLASGATIAGNIFEIVENVVKELKQRFKDNE